MTQKAFSEYTIPRLLAHFPQFAPVCTAKPDGIVDIAYPSSRGKLVLRVTTQDMELTVGFAADPTQFAWHMHMSQFGAYTPDEEIQAAVQLLDSIMTDQEAIAHSTVLGYFLPDDVSKLHEHQQPDEVISLVHWSEL